LLSLLDCIIICCEKPVLLSSNSIRVMSSTSNAPPFFDSVDSEDTWVQGPHGSTPLHDGLRSLEQSLRCPICKDFCRNPVSVQAKSNQQCCQHTFCSECIRSSFQRGLQSLKREACCPVCRAQVDASGVEFAKCLRPNRSVGVLVEIFLGIRDDLRTTLLTTAGQEPVASKEEQAAPPRRSSRRSEAAAVVVEPATAAVARTLIKKSRPAFTCMKKKQLQELCRKEGLSATGSEKDLVARYEVFLTLYNAEADATHPRLPADLVRLVEQRERARKEHTHRDQWGEAAAQSAYIEQAFKLRNAADESTAAVATAAIQESAIAQSFNANFAELISQARKNGKPPSVVTKEGLEQQQKHKKKKGSAALNYPLRDTDGRSKDNQKEGAIDESNSPLQEGVTLSGSKRRSPVSTAPAIPAVVSIDSPPKDNQNDTTTSTTKVESPTLSSLVDDDRVHSQSAGNNMRAPAEEDDNDYSPTNRRVKRSRATEERTESPSIIGPWSCVSVAPGDGQHF
jgi:hypothetical protein